MDFKLTAAGNDLDIENGQLTFVTGIDAVAQKVRMKLQSFIGESPYDIAGGTPWLQPGGDEANGGIYIFENTANPIANARFILTETINDVAGVIGVLELVVLLDSTTRISTITGRARGETGEEFNFQASVGGP